MRGKRALELKARQEILKAQIYEAASRKMAYFYQVMYPQYRLEWFQIAICEYLDMWIAKEIRKLAIFMPPQHTKSTMSSVLTPSMILGKNPSAQVVCASYNSSVSSKFNRLSQDVLSSDAYKAVFPKTILPQAGIKKGNELRNSSYYETVGYKGFFKSVGVGGSLTGNTVEYGVIDDPIKDRVEANSETYRNRLWDWYNDVWRTRLNNESCELLLFTRWHEDDLAGRLFDPNNEHYDEKRANEWTVIVLPALKEDAPPPIKQAIDIGDPREVGEALWESKHSRATHEDDKRANPYMFASLKQQRPAPLEGGLIKRDWLEIVHPNKLPFELDSDTTPPVHFMIDGAFTDKMENDPTAQMAYYIHNGTAYIKHCDDIHKQLNEYLTFVNGYFTSHGHGVGSNIRVEYKASGPALMSMLRQEQYGGWNCSRINDVHVSWGKMTRGEYATPALAAGRVKLIQGPWNEKFLKQVSTFPNDLHDDMYDLLCYMVLQEILKVGKRKHKTTVSLSGNII